MNIPAIVYPIGENDVLYTIIFAETLAGQLQPSNVIHLKVSAVKVLLKFPLNDPSNIAPPGGFSSKTLIVEFEYPSNTTSSPVEPLYGILIPPLSESEILK
jgi:hypothetical protein